MTLRWVVPIRIEIPHYHCVTMLETRFVLLIEIFVIRRCGITKNLWMMDSVSGRFLHGAQLVPVSLQT